MAIAYTSCVRSEEEEFSQTLVEGLKEKLSEQPLPHLTPNEMESLLVLLQTTLEVSYHGFS